MSLIETKSLASCFRALPPEIQAERVKALPYNDLKALQTSWAFWARPAQLPPAEFAAGRKTYWILKAGRGFGKTRAGAEQVRAWAREFRYVNLIGATSDDARDIMIEGESGILAICPDEERPVYRKSERKLVWPSGCQSLVFTADEPERLRGKQHEKLWADELGAWRYPEAWDQAQLGLRLGRSPQAVVTTTPRPTPLVKELLRHPSTVVTGGGTYDNRENLADPFFTAIIRKYEGTRLGRQELDAELLDDNPGALWQRSAIDKARVAVHPALKRIVVGVDPAVTSRPDSDETGIIAAGLGTDDQFYIIADASLSASPDVWARAVVKCYYDTKADRMIAETNNGGEMVELTIRTVDKNVAYKAVTASRGKMVRAEPIAALYEQGRVHHVGFFPQLEDQMCDYDPLTSLFSPDRMDALVWALTELSDSTGMAIIDFYRQQSDVLRVPAGNLGPTVRHTAPGLQFPAR
jgi:phage terminase large subunit-like protein